MKRNYNQPMVQIASVAPNIVMQTCSPGTGSESGAGKLNNAPTNDQW